jgi:UDP-N-acetylmuramoylalanine--D-glutamate ligase
MVRLFANTKALVVILGVHGGGVANAKWLFRHGAKVTVTDMRLKEELAPSLSRFSPEERKRISFILGRQRKKDFRSSELILLGPGVQKNNPWRSLSFALGKRVENDASLFLRYASHPIIGVTGTRGKTTTTNWIVEFLRKDHRGAMVCGNTPENALLREIDRKFSDKTPHVAEFSSWQLELAPISGRSPHIAVITNLYRDHLNTYDGMEDYADAKANIFVDQTKDDVLIMNHENPWTKYFLRKSPRSKTLLFSAHAIPSRSDGVFVRSGYAYLRLSGKERRIVRVSRFGRKFGDHNISNLLAAMLAVAVLDPKRRFTEKEILGLNPPRMRQEIIGEKKGIRVVNDSTATSPDGTIAAIRRFCCDSRVFLIAGGTDKSLEFRELAQEIKRRIPASRLTLISGTATDCLIRQLRSLGYEPPIPKETMEECVREAFVRARGSVGKKTVLLSPGAASFGKFTHEFDRGERFDSAVKKELLGRKRGYPDE